jgi:pilus biogenesis lipoprotein CpaD
VTNSFLRLLGVGLVAATLAACTTEMAEHDPHVSHPTTVQQKTARLDLGPLYAGKPNPNDAPRIDEFLSAYRGQGQAPLDVTVSGRSAEDPAAREQALQLANALMERGVNAEDINLYVQADQTAGTAHMAFPIYVVEAEECGYWDKPMDDDFGNGITTNFGCAVQRNTDLMAANPRDLAYPQPMTPGTSGGRAFYVMDHYTRGEALPSANDLQQDYNFKIF